MASLRHGFLEEDTANIPVKFVARINFRYSLCNVQHINALLVRGARKFLEDGGGVDPRLLRIMSLKASILILAYIANVLVRIMLLNSSQ